MNKFGIKCTIDELHPTTDTSVSLAIGSYQLRLGEQWYGRSEESATALNISRDYAVSFAESARRLSSELSGLSAEALATGYISVIYKEEPKNALEEALSTTEFSRKHTIAPDGDEGFDDGTHILVFAINDSIRLIGMRFDGHNISDITDVVVPAKEFAEKLKDWSRWFDSITLHEVQVLLPATFES